MQSKGNWIGHHFQVEVD